MGVNETRDYLEWLRNLQLDGQEIILRYSPFGWRAIVRNGRFTLYSANADDPTMAVGTLYRSRELSIDALERELAKLPW